MLDSDTLSLSKSKHMEKDYVCKASSASDIIVWSGDFGCDDTVIWTSSPITNVGVVLDIGSIQFGTPYILTEETLPTDKIKMPFSFSIILH